MLAQLLDIQVQPFDHKALTEILREYRFPRNKISDLLRSGDLLTLKKGMYVLGERYRRPPVLETVANLLYGPSYLSMEYVLALSSLIPEKIVNFTSVTCRRNKLYHTPLGTFSYQLLKPDYYNQGYLIRNREGSNYLIATPEKALCDMLYLQQALQSISELEACLFEDLRLDPDLFKDLDGRRIRSFAAKAGSGNLKLLSRMVSL